MISKLKSWWKRRKERKEHFKNMYKYKKIKGVWITEEYESSYDVQSYIVYVHRNKETGEKFYGDTTHLFTTTTLDKDTYKNDGKYLRGGDSTYLILNEYDEETETWTDKARYQYI